MCHIIRILGEMVQHILYQKGGNGNGCKMTVCSKYEGGALDRQQGHLRER